MQRQTLSKIATHLFRTKTHQSAYDEIWAVLKTFGLHSKTLITHEFTSETEKIIKDTAKAVERAEMAINSQTKTKK